MFPTPKYIIIPLVVTIEHDMMEKKRIKTKIWVGFVVKSKVGDTDDKIRGVRNSSTSKGMVGFLQAVVGKNKFLLKLEYRKKKEMISCSLVFLILKRILIWMSQNQTSPKKNKANC